ncbi:MAG TPA: ABC transporter permease [Aridibacter sp.]|nr:ABC transporter permease [Aridibacter sp.]
MTPLPERPITVIKPSKGWVPVDLRDLWSYRDLFYILALRDIKVRYKQTLLGVAWAVIQPLATMIIFTVLFGRIANMPSDGIPYPIFAYAGLLPWTFFANAVTNSGNSLVGNTALITKVYFPRLLIPMATVAAGLVDFMIAFGILLILMLLYGVPFTLNLAILPFLLVLTSLTAVGVGLWMSALNVKYRDVRHALPFLVQIGMFVTPIIYPPSAIPEQWRWIITLNPLAGQIEAYRAAIVGRPFDWLPLGVSVAVTAAILVYSAFMFKRMERRFADII